MSAYVVDEKHISTLILNYSNLFHKRIDKDKQIELAGKLAWGNIDSVNYRYQEFKPNDAIQYVMNVKNLIEKNNYDQYISYEKLEMQELINMVRCLDYQSCEIPNYRSSEVSKILDEMIDAFTFVMLEDYKRDNPNKIRWSYPN